MSIKLSIILILITLPAAVLSQDTRIENDSSKTKLSTDTIDVNANLFKKNVSINSSFNNAVYEEIHKTPGAMEDVIRYFISAPGVSIGNDVNNELIVRGGSPIENLTIIDGIEVQNPNHYGAPGSSSGVLSYINLKMVEDVDFYTGGFPPKYGDRLSSVMNIKFREGNKEKHLRDINVSATGVGGFFEGPINSKSSYMFSIRRSYLELIAQQLNTPLLPQYWDFNLKMNYDLNKFDKISLVGLYATDDAKPFTYNQFQHDTVNVKILSEGINFSHIEKNIEFRLSTGYNWNFYKVNYDNFLLDINDNEFFIRQELSYKLNSRIIINGFSGIKYYNSKYNVFQDEGFNSSNYYTPGVSYNNRFKAYKFDGGINVTSDFLNKKLSVNIGCRFDSFQFINDKFVFSPRAGLTYMISPGTFINGNAGIYYQAPEFLWVLSNTENRNLKYIRADEYVIGLEHFFRGNIKISAEGYLKQYSNYPVSLYDPNFIFINSGVDINPNFLDLAVSKGNGFVTGLDLSFQKKNNGTGFYWTLNYSYSKSKFAALAGDLQLAEFDYGSQLLAILGLKFNDGLAFSARLKYAGGRPYTPYDQIKSIAYGRGIFDLTKYNKGKLPEYIRVDAKVEENLILSSIRLNVYVEVENVFNRKNIYGYYYGYGGESPILEWSIVPILGFSCQF